jgi:hypothetical protein
VPQLSVPPQPSEAAPQLNPSELQVAVMQLEVTQAPALQ